MAGEEPQDHCGHRIRQRRRRRPDLLTLSVGVECRRDERRRRLRGRRDSVGRDHRGAPGARRGGRGHPAPPDSTSVPRSTGRRAGPDGVRISGLQRAQRADPANWRASAGSSRPWSRRRQRRPAERPGTWLRGRRGRHGPGPGSRMAGRPRRGGDSSPPSPAATLGKVVSVTRAARLSGAHPGGEDASGPSRRTRSRSRPASPASARRSPSSGSCSPDVRGPSTAQACADNTGAASLT